MKTYKVQRKSIVGAAIELFPKTIQSLTNLVICGAASSLIYAKVYSTDFIRNSRDSDIYMTLTLFVLCFATGYVANRVYKNFQQERDRLRKLIEAMDAEKEEKRLLKEEGFITPEQLFQLRLQKEVDRGKKIINFEDYKKILDGESEQEVSDDNVTRKRKSLSTKPFNYEDYDF